MRDNIDWRPNIGISPFMLLNGQNARYALQKMIGCPRSTEATIAGLLSTKLSSGM